MWIAANRPPALARGVQISAVMLRPTAFARTMIDSATIRPFFAALLEMKRARVHMTRRVAAASAPLEVEAPVVLATPRAA